MLCAVLFSTFQKVSNHVPIPIFRLNPLWGSGVVMVEIELKQKYVLPLCPTVHPWTQGHIGRAADSALGGPHTPLWHKSSQQTETGQ